MRQKVEGHWDPHEADSSGEEERIVVDVARVFVQMNAFVHATHLLHDVGVVKVHMESVQQPERKDHVEDHKTHESD